ncbi:cyclic GMP-AMP synthase-like receptor isoform 1-T1 [Aphomia sociella]
MSKQKKNLLELYLTEVFKNFISLKDNDVKKSQEVFKSVFEQVRESMSKQCNYFAKYSSQVMYGGSVYDGIKVAKLDEFDMDIVIRLPISYEDGENGITIENEQPGFVKLKITKAFDNLLKQGEWENCHKVTHSWRDNESYLRQDKFRHWIQSIVQKSMNDFNGQITVNGVVYTIKYTLSGPAYTLKIASLPDDDPFKLDVDLVPVIRFTHPRWPQNYRDPNSTTAKDWLVVPKPNKAIKDAHLQNRCWRLSFQDFEKELMKGCQNLKTTIRLVKKMRDVLEMKAIASYYIKTLFLWKVSNNNKKYWETKLSVLLKIMLEELYKAIDEKNIPYFWNEHNNLIESLKDSLQREYKRRLKNVLDGIEANDMDKVLPALLTPDELTRFKTFDIYQKHIVRPDTVPKQVSKKITIDAELFNKFHSNLEELSKKVDELTAKIKSLKVDDEIKSEYLKVVHGVEEISYEIEDFYDYDNPKRLKLSDGRKGDPRVAFNH